VPTCWIWELNVQFPNRANIGHFDGGDVHWLKDFSKNTKCSRIVEGKNESSGQMLTFTRYFKVMA
jgi:hypothetical protein